jgi:hypothetical protein
MEGEMEIFEKVCMYVDGISSGTSVYGIVSQISRVTV